MTEPGTIQATTITLGTILTVTADPLGSELEQACPVGAVTLTVDNVADFDETGGLLRLGGDDPNAEVLRYTGFDEPGNDDDLADDTSEEGLGPAAYEWTGSGIGSGGGLGGEQEWYRASLGIYRAETVLMDEDLAEDQDEIEVGPATIYLEGQTGHAWPEETRVDLWDAGTGEPSMQWRALVRPVADQDNTDAIDAVITHSLIPLLPEGSRDEDTAETVRLTDETGDWTLTEIIGRRPTIQPDSLPIRLAAGQITVALSNEPSGGVQVDFPPDRFTASPVAVATVTNASPHLYGLVGAVTRDSMFVYARRADSTNVTTTAVVHWIAVQAD